MSRPLCLILLSLSLLVISSGCRREKGVETIRLSGQTMGTTWSVVIPPDSVGTDTAALRQRIQDRLDRINRLMSTYDPESEISRFNDLTSTDWFDISEETADVIGLSLEISSLTGGAFDISVGPLVDLWGFGPTPQTDKLPSEERIVEALSMVGYENIELRRTPPSVRKKIPTLRIDLSAVAKGYAVDALAALLESEGIRHYLVEIGGELKASGRRDDGSPWRIAIEKPLEGRREVERIFPLTDVALATSGNYRNYYVVDGERYSHTLDPTTGRPARHKLASVTVVDESCARADALATALMVLGEEEGRRFCEKNRVAAFFLVHDRTSLESYASSAFQNLVEGIKE